MISNGNAKTKKINIWKIPGLLMRVETLIRDGTFKNGGINSIHSIINKEFEVSFKTNSIKLDTSQLKRKLSCLIFSHKVMAEIKDAIRKRFDPDKVYEAVSYIPYELFMAQWNKLRGKSLPKNKSIGTVRGILRISDELKNFSGEPIDFTEGTFEKPFEIKSSNSVSKISFLNGTNLGVPYSGVIEENPAYLALRNAKVIGDDAVIITNFLNLSMKKASGALIVYRALYSGRNINPNTLDPNYIEKASRILKLKPHDEMVYQTTSEAFLDLIGGWRKIVGTKEKPTFDGPIYIVLGHQEEEIVAAGAYWEIHYLNLRNQNLIEGKMRIVRSDISKTATSLRKIRKQIEDYDIDDDDLENKKNDIDMLRQQIKSLESAEKKYSKQLDDLLSEYARTRITYISQDDLKQYYFKVLRFVIKTIEETIPNSKVIGIGSSYIKRDGKIEEIHIPSHNRPSDNLLSSYVSSYGSKVIEGKMADDVIICHPFSPNFRMTVRESDKNGQRKSSNIYVAPIAIDEIYIYKVTRNTVRRVTELSKAMSDQFKAGVLRLSVINKTTQSDIWSIPALQNFNSKISNRKSSSSNSVGKFIWTLYGTDPHYGSASREIFIGPDGKHFGTIEAFIQLMRRDGLLKTKNIPIHMFVMNDDPTQGHHFPAEQQPDRQKIPTIEIEKRIIELKKKIMDEESSSKRYELLNELQKIAMKQIELRPPYWVQEQVIEVLERFFKPNLDFFDAMLMRDLKIGLKATGISEISGEMSDTCDAGLVVIGTGNHFLNSVEGQMTESFIYTRELILRLATLSHWRDKEMILKKIVTSPLYGNVTVGWGTIQLNGKYIYGVDHRSSPTGSIDWSDPLKGAVRNNARRGNVSRIHENKVVIKDYGDKHFMAVIITADAIYIMAPPAVHTDKFAEFKYGFPPNNTGVALLGVPADGPNNGPILVRSLMFDSLKEIFENNLSIDWDALISNPV